MEAQQTHQLVERQAELAELSALLADAGAGRGSVALVSGPAGSGKTQLLQSFCKQAANSSAFLLTAVASRAECELPLGVMDQLFRCETLPPDFRRRVNALLADELSANHAAGADPVMMNQPSITVANELRSLLLELSERGPVVVSIDDLQFADGPSLQMLLFLQRRMKSSRLLLLLAELSTVRSPHPVFHAELFRQPNCRKIRLDMLTRSGAHTMIAARLGPAKALELTDPYHEASGGSPLFLSALLDDYQAIHRLAGRLETEPAVSQPAFRNALTDCLYLAEPAAFDVARAVAALGTVRSSVLIGHILGLNTATVEHAIASLTATGLLDAEGFRHPAARTAILEEMAPEARHELHLRVATALQNDGVPPVAVAEQLVAAGTAPEAWMINVLRDAAHSELAASRTGMACEYLDLALNNCRDSRPLAALTADRMRIEWQKSPLKAMRHAERLMEASQGGHLTGQDTGLLARSLLWHGRYREARETLTRWEANGTASDRAESEELAALTGWMAYSFPALLTESAGSAATQEADTGPDSVRPFGRQAVSLLSRLLADGPGDEAVTNAEGILHSVGLGTATLDSLHAALLTLICADRPDRAAAWCEELLKEAEQQGASTWQAAFAAVRADAAFRQGDMATAVKQGEAALSQLPAAAWGVVIGGLLANLILATTMMGQHDKAVKYIRLPVPDTIFESRYGLHYLYARGHFHLSTDRPAAALTDFESCGRLMEAWGLDLPSLISWRSGAAEAALALGLKSRARTLIEEQLTRPGTQQPRTRGASLRLLAAAGGVEDRPALLQEAVSLLQPDTGRFELARALADLSAAYHELGEHDRARETAERAADMMESCHIPSEWAQPLPVVRPPHATPAVASAGPSRPAGPGASDAQGGPQKGRKPVGVDALSDAERRVAELAAQGVPNRAIGRKFFITVSTVEQHLTRVYRKLDVSRRSDLAAKLHVSPPEAESA
ncbi:regulatory protein, luxR family [Streptomyces sp. 2323.1]|uniref:helix-turn-helix transcriptional regulator n=1 Tax=Streptomyces sp. 2323.1 TaxID=1938841 RepID=UPI000BB91879|nr:LuxR family transcriptional regulator [Streptomyces sp. 2323.1]SOE09509.1 regulatory protein, luxR family [Streptomyces sp. 2323.1]